ncbi:MAG: hypothetical protein RL318_797 [Fibrobacterota bacterium]
MRPFVLVLLVAASLSFAENALVNGDFESDLLGWDSWGGVSTSEHFGGAKGCMIRLGVAGWAGVSQTIKVPQGKASVKVTGWLRADSIRSGKENWERGRLSVEFFGAKGDTLGGYPPAVGQVRGKLPWTRMERTYALPAGATMLKLGCALGNSSGTLYCDDLAVEFMP